jgi:K+-sensing histidine kinase KdpD
VDDTGDGAGVGLAIAERAVSVHQGTIRVMNAVEGGLIVEIGYKNVQGSRHD